MTRGKAQLPIGTLVLVMRDGIDEQPWRGKVISHEDCGGEYRVARERRPGQFQGGAWVFSNEVVPIGEEG